MRAYLFQLDERGAIVGNLLIELLPHELTHLVLQEYFGERPIPRALNEGLAMYMEAGNRGDKYGGPAYEAVLRGKPFPLSELYAAFRYPKNPTMVWLFYSQSASATRFLVDRPGPESTAKMLAEVKHGRPMEDALRQATGQRGDVLGGIERAWRRNILKHPPKKPRQMKRPADLNKK